MHGDADHRFHVMGEVAGAALRLFHVGRRAVAALDHHIEAIKMALAVQFQLIVRRQTLVGQYQLLDLRRENIDPMDDQHVVGTPVDPFDPPHRAGGAGDQAGEVAGAIAHHWLRFLGQRGQHQLAVGAVG